MFSCIIYISNEYFDILLIKLLFIFILRNILNKVTAITQKIGLQFLFQKIILFEKNLLPPPTIYVKNIKKTIIEIPIINTILFTFILLHNSIIYIFIYAIKKYNVIHIIITDEKKEFSTKNYIHNKAKIKPSLSLINFFDLNLLLFYSKPYVMDKILNTP